MHYNQSQNKQHRITQQAQLSPRDLRDALYQLKYWPTVVQVTQRDRLSA